MALLGLLLVGASLIIFGNARGEGPVAGIWECNFESDECDITSSPIGVRWTRRNKADLLAQHVPNRPSDVPPAQWYLHLPLRHDRTVEEPGLAVGSTPTFPGISTLNPEGDFCFTYWMYMASDQENEFRFGLTQDNDGTSVYRVLARFIGNAAPTWRRNHIEFRQANPFEFQLYAMILPTSTSNFSQIALDDLVLTTGKCSLTEASGDQISCDFEEGWCGYQVTNTDGDDKWIRTSWNTAEQNGLGGTGEIPHEDSTYHTGDGNYLVFQHKKKTNAALRRTSIVSAPEKVIGSHCISFHYQIYKRSNTYGITLMLTALYADDAQAEVIWSSATSYGYRWVAAEAEFTVPEGTTDLKSFKVEFTTQSLGNTEGIAALDDITFSAGKCSKIGDCNFNLGAIINPGREYCSWEPVTESPFNMIWAIGNPEHGPENAAAGEYIYFRGGRGSGNLLKYRALLASQQMVYDISKCMTFQYYMNVTGAAEIRVHQVYSVDQERVLWAVNGLVSEGDTSTDVFGWRFARVPLQSLNHDNFIITIEGKIKREISEQYTVAIDNIQFLQDPCTLAPPIAAPLPVEEVPEEHGASVCNFDDDQTNDDCGYITDEDATAQFHLRTGNTYDEYYSMHAPMFDRTTLEEYGRYLYFAPIKAPQGTYARQISPEYKRDNPADPRCLNFWYYFRSGAEAGELNVYARFNGTDELLWSTSDSAWWISMSYEWSLATAAIPPTESFQIVLEAMIMKNDGYLSAAFDDITVQMTECKVMDCDFEEGFCTWHNYFDAFGTTDLEWEFTNENLLPELQSPGVPHGRFIFVPVESTTPAGHQAMLEHYEVMKSNEHVCLQFDYFITTVNTGSLAVYWFDKEGEVANYAKIWSTERTNRFGQWESGQALIVSNKPWNVMLVATARPTNSSIPADKIYVIALDNIRHRVVTDAATCPSLPVNSLITTPAPPTTTANPMSNNSIVYSCSFDENLCGFEIDPESTIQWQRIAEEWTVPPRPGAIRGNNFLYADLLNEKPVFRFGRITSPVINVDPGVNQFFCIQFWVYMDSFSENKLMVYLYDPPTEGLVLEYFTGSFPWTVKSINIQRNHMFQIRFFVQNALDLNRYEGIAIDEFTVEAGKCSAHESSPTSETCDFEEGPCKFSVSGAMDDFKWSITNGHGNNPTDSFLMSVKPDTDHTYSAPGGHYAFAYLGPKTDAWTTTQETDLKYANVVSLSGDQCVSFFYRLLKGNVKGGPTLKVSMKSGSTQRTLWTSNVAHGRKWVALKATVLSRGLDATYDLDVTFTASGAKGSKGAIAVDDFAITPGACDHPGDCKFNTGSGGICDWSHLPLSEYATMQWTNKIAPGGPQSDSAYIYIEGGRPTGHLPRSRAVLYSENLLWPAEQAMCMTFKFFSNASGAAVVRVHQVEDPSDYNPLWENFGREAVNTSQGESVWHHAQIPLEKPKAGEEFLITIEGYIRREVDVVYFIAVEDVLFVNQACILTPADSIPIPTVAPPEEDTANVCTFDNDMCEWTSESSGPQPYTWQLLTGRDRDKDPNVPAFDHSTLESFGYFIYFNASMAPPTGTIIAKTFTGKKPNEPACLRFWMYMQGENPGEVHFTVEGQGFQEMEIAAYAGWDSRRWSQYTVAIPASLTQYILRIEGRDSLDSGKGGIALDNIAVSPGVCKQVDCNFEHGLCSWENYYDNLGNMEYDFVYGTSNILPSDDDSVDRGVFVYVPIRSTTPRGQTFLRHDSLVAGDRERDWCLHFDYLITSEYIGRLTLWHYWLNEKNEYDYETVWSSRGEPNYNSWQKGQIHLDRNSSWTLMFEVAMDGPSDNFFSSRLHGIAIDNIEHEPATSADLCPTLPRQAPTTTTTRGTTTLRMTTSRPTSSIGNTILQSCNFDKDTCGWTEVSGSTIKWHRAHQDYGEGDNAWAVPYRLDNFKNDWFLFADTTGKPNGNRVGSITTPAVPAMESIAADYCLRFWIVVEADEDSEINIIRKDAPPASRETILERYIGEARPQWTAEHIPFTAQSAFQIMFKAIAPRGAESFGVVAVDEYVLEAGKCSNDQVPEHPGVYCDFEEDDCGYTNSGDSQFLSWTRTSREQLGTTSDLMLIDLTPSQDNTMGSIEGHYAFIYLGLKMNSIDTGKRTAVYKSPPHTLRGEQCVTFFYRHVKIPSAASRAELIVTVTDGDREWNIFRSDMPHGKKWVGAKGSFTPNNKTADYPFSVSFSVSGYKDTRSAVAIDDIAIVPESCQHVGDCTFNTGSTQLCMWNPYTGEDAKMQWKIGLPKGGPPKDSGYMYFMGGPKSGNPIGSRAVLYSPDMFTEPNLCMTFNYFMNSSGAAVVRVHLVEEITGPASYNPIWEDYGRDEANTTLGGNGWHHAQIPIVQTGNASAEFLILIEGVVRRETGLPYFMAFDDMVFLRGPCPLTPESALPIPTVTPSVEDASEVCTFDDDVMNHPMCDWEHDTGATLRWQIINGYTGMQDTFAPNIDHTTVEPIGNYLYTNLTKVRSGNSAAVTSRSYDRVKPTDPRCVKFWYYMTGDRIGILNVYGSHDRLGSNQIFPVFNGETFNTGRWYMREQEVPLEIMSFKLRFEAESYSDAGDGGIAIDDIAVLPHNCVQMECNFEHGMCNWENYYDDYGNMVLDWLYGAQSILPSDDDSINRGIFMYVPVRPSTPARQTALMRHDTLVDPDDQFSCFHFEYLITARNVGRITVWLYWLNPVNNQYDYKQIWVSRGQANVGKWQPGQFFIDRTEKWTLMIEAMANDLNLTIPSGNQGIAIDNFKLDIVPDAAHCPTVPGDAIVTTPTPPTTATTRPTTTQAPDSFACNFDGGNFCGWTQRSEDKYKFLIGQNGSTEMFGPAQGDHSQYRDGKYIYIDAPSGSAGNEARIFSPKINRKSPYCFRFFYNMNGNGMGQINLYEVRKGGPAFSTTWKPPKSFTGRNYGDQWIGAAWTITTATEKQIVLEAVRGTYTTSFIAIDDVSIKDGVCELEGRCDFSDDWCQFNPYAITSSGYWEVPPSMSHALVTDHMSQDDSAVFRTDVLPAQQKLCLRFKFMVEPKSYLIVRSIEYPEGSRASIVKEIWKVEGTAATSTFSFIDARVPVTLDNKGTNPIQLSFEAHFIDDLPGHSRTLAVDDVFVETVSTCNYAPSYANPDSTTPSPGTTLDFVVETVEPPTGTPVETPISKYNCDFDQNNFCLWASSSGTVRWKLSNIQVDTLSGPTTDHSGHGYFAYFDPMSQVFSTSGRLESPYIEWSGDEEKPSYYIFSFWYYMHGSAIKELRVNTQKRNSNGWESISTLTGDKGKRWYLERLVLTVDNEDFKVALEGIRRGSILADSNAYIAVDDITFEAGKIPDQFDDTTCDFDTIAWCGYSPESNSQSFMWAWRNGQDTATINDTGPLFDKSQNSAYSTYGHYMAVSAKDSIVGDTSRLISTLHDPTTGVCLKFYYYRRTRQSFPGALEVYLLKNQNETGTIWSDDDMIGGDFWEPVFLEIQSPEEYWKIVWNAKVVSLEQPVIAIDHIVITEGLCPQNLIQCGFNDDSTCEWDDGFDDQVNWVLESGASQTQGTGPDSDALNDIDGGYLVFEATTADVDDTARMLSTPITNEGREGACFKFHYHMFGVDVGELQVIQKNMLESGDNELVLWSLSGNQQNQWHMGQVQITTEESNTPYQIIFQAKRNGVLGNIAIDEVDISFFDLNSDCRIKPEIAVPLPTTPPTTTVMPTPHPNGTCTFEDGTCGWNGISLTDAIKWKRTRAATQNLIGDGPAKDHTTDTGSGYYMVFDPRLGKENDTGRLESGTRTQPSCVQFFYHAGGRHTGELRVISHGSSGGELLHWSRKSPDDGEVWQFGEASITHIAEGNHDIYQVVFEAIRGKGTDGDIALDDITVVDGPCHESVDHCTFEEGYCGFSHHQTSDGMTWQRVTPLNNSLPILAPIIDVTTGIKDGYFLMANRHPTATAGVATIASPVYTYQNSLFTNMDHCVRFYYAMQTRPRNSTDGLTVRYGSGADAAQTLMEQLTGDQGWEWHLATHPIPSRAGPFQVFFTATLNSVETVIAIDDVAVTPGACKHTLDCTFDGDSFCLWKNADQVLSGHSQIFWRAVSPSQGLSSGPLVDASGGQHGWFAMASADAPSKPGDVAWLVSPQIPRDTSTCLTFWFYQASLNGEVSKLRLRSVDFENLYTRLLWKIDWPRGGEGQWTAGQVQVDGAPWLRQLVFEAEIGSFRTLSVAIDNIVVLDHACSPAFDISCSFEDNSMCAWANDPNNLDECTWTVRTGPAESTATGPTSDHTVGDVTGHYLYFSSRQCNNATYPDVGLRGTAVTTMKSVAGELNCLKFWYFMYGAPGMLMVQVNSTSDDAWVEYLRNGNQGKRWIEARVTIENVNDAPYYIKFEAMMGPSRFGDIAIDDIRFDDGQCESASNTQCDFEGKGFCGYKSIKTLGSENFLWRHVKITDIDPFGIDHTFTSNHGHVAHADGGNSRKGARTYMVSPTYKRTPFSSQCLTFWYKINPYPTGGRLAVHVLRATQSNDFTSPDWWVTGSNIDEFTWELGVVPINLGEDFKVAFDAQNDNGTVFMLDDVSVVDGACPALLACTFEDGMCGWSNGILDNIEWIVHRGDGVPNEMAGPSTDALLNPYGYYIYIDNDYPNADDYDAAHLTSQRVTGNADFYCFSFYYHMYIDSRSNASLDLSVVSGGQTSDSIFFRNEAGRNLWWREAIELANGIDFGGDFMLQFTGKVHGQKGKSDIALDEFTFSMGKCADTGPPPTFSCNNGAIIEGWKQCNFRVDCENGRDEENCGNCNFEQDMCGYTRFNNNNFTWNRVALGSVQAPTPNAPAVDGSRWYMLADLKDGPARSAAYFDSPIIRQTSQNCKLNFWVYLYGDQDPGALIATMRIGDSDTSIAIIDQNVGTPKRWNLFVVHVGRHSGEFRFVFRARKGTDEVGSIGVDEITFKNCDFPPARVSCGAGEWQCPESRACIVPSDNMCDFADDCGYFEDEQNCQASHPIRCNFDEDFCDWTQAINDNFQWLRTNERTLSGYTGPLRDHTTGLRGGGFIYASSTFYDNATTGGKANRGRLMSRFINVNSGSECKIRFFYHVYGSTEAAGTLRVFRSDTLTPLFTVTNNQGDQWIKGTMIIRGPAINVMVILEAELGGRESDVAVDDISFSGGCSNKPDIVTLPPTTTEATTVTTTTMTPATTTLTTTATTTPTTTISTPSTTRQLGSSSTTTTSTRSTSGPRPGTTTPSTTTNTAPGTTHSALTCPGRFCTVSSACLDQSQMCDGKSDCEDGFDEMNCSTSAPAAGLDGGAVAGIVIACLAVVGAAGGGAYVVMYRRRKDVGSSEKRSTTGYATFGALDGAVDDDTDADNVGNRVMHDIFSKDL